MPVPGAIEVPGEDAGVVADDDGDGGGNGIAGEDSGELVEEVGDFTKVAMEGADVGTYSAYQRRRGLVCVTVSYGDSVVGGGVLRGVTQAMIAVRVGVGSVVVSM